MKKIIMSSLKNVSLKTLVFLMLGHVCFLLGFIGLFLPILPTTPFLLLALYFYSQSSTKIHQWLLNHPHLGKTLRDWETHHAISPKAKILSFVMLTIIYFWKILPLNVHWSVKGLIAGIFLTLIIYIMTRPNPPRS